MGLTRLLLEKFQILSDVIEDITKIRTKAYTDFLFQASKLIHSYGKKVRINLNVDWFRPASERPGSRKLAYPANIEFEWRKWIDGGIMDEAVLRIFAKPFSGIFGDDRIAHEMIEKCFEKDIPLSVNRYVWANENLIDEFHKVYASKKFKGFIFYETWSFIDFMKDGNCRISSPEYEPVVNLPEEVWRTKAITGKMLKELFRVIEKL